MDALSIVENEVALEGLDGLTVPSLWVRLETRTPPFPLTLDPHTKAFIWKALIHNCELSFYELPEERGDVKVFDRFADIDPETGIETTETFAATKTDIYPVHVIVEDKNGVQGSCASYKERTDVSNIVRSSANTPLLGLEEAFKRYGRKLVVVASQEVRFRALIGPEGDPDLTLGDQTYCILERVGRARWQGEVQRDLHNVSFKLDPGKLHYLRKSLVENGLVTMQSYVSRMPNCQQLHSILLLLKRFHVNRRTKYDILMESLSNALEATAGQLLTMVAAREQLKVTDKTFKRVYQYMQSARMVKIISVPVEDLDPSEGPCNTKRGTKITTRCLQLIKPFIKKDLMVDDDDDDDEDGAAALSKGRVMERDLLLQGYHLVLSVGTRGITMSTIASRLHVGKLESRMICRTLERSGMIKGFMEDVGRQRVTKFISHKCVNVSDQLQQFAKERERNKLLCSGATPKVPKLKLRIPKTPSSTSRSKSKGSPKTPPAQKDQQTDREEQDNEMGTTQMKPQNKRGRRPGKKTRKETRKKRKAKALLEENTIDSAVTESIPVECETTPHDEGGKSEEAVPETLLSQGQAPVEEKAVSIISPAVSLPQCESQNEASSAASDTITIIEHIPKQVQRIWRSKKTPASKAAPPHETYRLLRRKNMIVESVRSLKIIEGLFMLQKMINDEEKLDGVNTKVCKKTILRLIRSLSREGMVKMFTTTVIQDGISKKVDFVVHPSIQPSDDIMKSAIEQIRFRISGSYTVARQQRAQEKARERQKKSDNPKVKVKDDESFEFKPLAVKGMSKAWGYQPKMHRLRVIHNFLWYLIHGHPLRQGATGTQASSQSPADTNAFNGDTATHAVSSENPEPSNPPSSGNDLNVNNTHNSPDADGPRTTSEDLTSSTGGLLNAGSPQPEGMSAQPDGASPQPDGTPPRQDGTASDDQDDEFKDTSNIRHFHPNLKVYVDESSWKRFIPPIPVHKEYGSGWSLVGDLLLCMPLSIFVQITQLNYMVEGLAPYLKDPVKQHYLVRFLPAALKLQLLYKRRYVFSFHEHLQRLSYMGLLHFGHMEKFQEKDQVFVYLKNNSTIVDTTSSEPHYWLVKEPADKPFERRHYAFNTIDDVENYWFDLLCVSLNTPLGVIRPKRSVGGLPLMAERGKFTKLAYLLKGSREVSDDGLIPGDNSGAGGLDSGFFSHLKRNWVWTSSLLKAQENSSAPGELNSNKIRLKSILNKNSLRLSFAGGSTAPRCVTPKSNWITTEHVEVAEEPASRNQQVAGGRRRKRKRPRKEVVKPPRKKRKEPKTRSPAHDETDHRALKKMTRQRVIWTIQEDSLMMLCSVASHLLNGMIKRPFVPYCVVRDLLHTEFESAQDKTSVAVGRRTRAILKNSQTLLNYRICLAEVYQDKPLLQLLQGKKPTNPDDPQDCAAAFSEFTRLLRQRFSSDMNSCNLSVPDTREELFSRFKVFTIDEGKGISSEDSITCIDDIHAIVLNNLMQSTLVLSNSQMKISRSFQTFHIYSKYSQEVLCQVFVQCRKKGLVNRRRISKNYVPKKTRALPILPMSFQMSQIYFRYFLWRIPVTLCTDAFRFVRTVNDTGAGDRPLLTFYNETEWREGLEDRGTESGEGNLKEKEGTEGKNCRLKENQCDEEKDVRPMPEPPSSPAAPEEPQQTGSLPPSSPDAPEEPQQTGSVPPSSPDAPEEPQQTGSVPPSSPDAPEEPQQTGSVPPSSPDAPEEPQQTGSVPPSSPDAPEEPQQTGSVPPSRPDAPEEPQQTGSVPPSRPDAPEEPQQTGSVPPSSPDAPEEPQQTGSVPPSRPDAPEEPQKTGSLPPSSPAAPDEPEDFSSMVPFSLDSPGGACAACLSLMTLGLLSVHVSIPKQVVVVDSNLVDNEVTKSMATLDEDDDDNNETEECDAKKKMELKSHQASHTNYLIMRGFCSPGIAKIRNLSVTDSIVVESCFLRVQMRNTPAHQMFNLEPSPPLDLSKCGPSLLPSVLTHSLQPTSLSSPSTVKECEVRLIQRYGYTPQDLEACAEIQASLDAAGVIGLSKHDLYQAHKHLAEPPPGHTRNIQQYMKELQEQGQVVQVGGLGPRWVLMGHASPWILTSKSRPRSQSRRTQEGKRPWRSQHNIPFLRKRGHAGYDKQEEPPGKRPAVETENEGADGLLDGTRSADQNGTEESEERERAEEGKKSTDIASLSQSLPEAEMDPVEVPENIRVLESNGTQETEVTQEQGGGSIGTKEAAGSPSPPPSTAPAENDDEDDVSFISRPWRLVDSSLNRPVCKGMLEAIMFHIMSRPGLTQQSLVEHYQNVLQPIAICELVQTLIELGCVTKRVLVKRPKTSLFSRPAHPQTVGTAGLRTEEADAVFYEPTISCSVRLAQVFPNEPHWNYFSQS